jgi:hypothetical protein
MAIEVDWSDNLVTNDGFEVDTTGWTTGGINTLVTSTAQAKFGSKSGLMIYANNLGFYDYAITLTATLHTLSAWLYVPANWDGGTIRLRRNAFTSATGDETVNADMTLTDQWQHLVLTFTPDAGDLIGSIRVDTETDAPTATRTLYLDGVRCVPFADVTADLRSLHVVSGREGPIGMAAPASCTIVLQNRARDYSPENASSSLYPNVKTRKSVKVHADNATLFSGRIDDISVEVTPNSSSQVTLHCLDDTAFLLRDSGPVYTPMTDSTEGDLEGKNTGDFVTAILDEVSWGAGDRTIDAGQTLGDTFWIDGLDGFAAMQMVAAEEHAFAYQDAEGRIVFRDRLYRHSASAKTPAGTWTDAAAGTHRYSDLGVYATGIENVYNQARASAQPRRNDNQFTLWNLSAAELLAPLETRVFVASWSNPAHVTQIATNWGTKHTANTKADGTGIDITAFVTLTHTANRKATRWDLTIWNGADHVPSAYLTSLQAGVIVREEDGDPTQVVREDTVSQGEYGIREFSGAPFWIGDEQEARDWAGYPIRAYKNPIPVVEVTFRPNNDTTLAHLLARKLNDRVTLVNAELGVNDDFFIEGIECLLRDKGFEMTFTLSKVVLDNGFLTVGHATLGKVATSVSEAGYAGVFG